MLDCCHTNRKKCQVYSNKINDPIYVCEDLNQSSYFTEQEFSLNPSFNC